MAERKGIDYSGGLPGGEAIVAAGYDFVMRYLWPDTPKGIDPEEIADLRKHGIAIGLVYEWNEHRALTAGYDGGKADARYARARATELGIPEDVTIYYAVDTNVSEDDYPELDAYFRGIASVEPVAVIGGYVEKALGQHLRGLNLITQVWQPAASSWSDYQLDPHANIRQLADGGAVNGVGIDPNLGFEDMGLWEPEEDMTAIEDLKLALFSGAEEGDLSREERLKNADYRIAQRVDGGTAEGGWAQSVGDQAGSALAAITTALDQVKRFTGIIEQHLDTGGLEHTQVDGGVLQILDDIRQRLDEAGKALAGGIPGA